MATTPIVDPKQFAQAFETFLAAVSGAIELDKNLVTKSRAIVSKLSVGKGTEAQVMFAAVAFSVSATEKQFSALIARGEALIKLLGDPERQAVWAARGWLKLSQTTAGSVAPARFLLVVAATCPLRQHAETFNVSEFEGRAATAAKNTGL